MFSICNPINLNLFFSFVSITLHLFIYIYIYIYISALVTLNPSVSVSLFGIYETGGSPLMFIAIMFLNDLFRSVVSGRKIGIFCHLGGGVTGFFIVTLYLSTL